MKKRIILLILVSMLIMGTVSAASLHGDYNGNPIVKITSNGEEINAQDVPAMNYNGRTMVPVYMLGNLGANVKWDSKTQTVDVNLPSHNIDLNIMKEYAVLFDYYTALQRLGDKFFQTQTSLILDLTYIKPGSNQDNNLQFASTDLTALIDEYNRIQNLEAGIITNANKYGIVDNSINVILINYSKGIDYFKAAVEKLYSYNTNANYSNDFFDQLRLASVHTETANADAFTGYNKYFNLIQSFQSTSFTKPITVIPPQPPTPFIVDKTGDVVESKIDGDFEGWDGDTIFKLANGQIWQQSSFEYHYHYAYRPDVLIYKDKYGTYKMKVDGIDDTISVIKIK